MANHETLKWGDTLAPPYNWDDDDWDQETTDHSGSPTDAPEKPKSSATHLNKQPNSQRLEDEPQEKESNVQQTVVYSCPVDHSGTHVYVKGWPAHGSPNRPLLIVHDVGENVGLYRETGKQLVAKGYSVYGFDLRGHGRSGRILGHIPKFDTLISDLLQVVAWVRHQNNGKLPILLGQGVGSLIVAFFQEAHPKLASACVFCSPCFRLASEVPLTKRFFIRSMSEIAPTRRLPPAVTPRFTSVISRDKVSIIESLTDIQGLRITANFANELLHAMTELKDRVFGFRTPSLFIYSLQDNVCDYSTLEEIEKAVYRGSRLQVVPLAEGGHHLLNESDESRQAVLSVLVPWLDSLHTNTQPQTES